MEIGYSGGLEMMSRSRGSLVPVQHSGTAVIQKSAPTSALRTRISKLVHASRSDFGSGADFRKGRGTHLQVPSLP